MNNVPILCKSIKDNVDFLNSELFAAVQLSGIFSDSKTFADATAKISYTDINQAFAQQQNKPNFNLKQFVLHYFSLPSDTELSFPQKKNTPSEQITALWQVLQKSADGDAADSLLPLQHNYIIPGGRFREIYYWDSYFTAVGLMADKQDKIVTAMLQNFIELQQKYGLIPNGNRSYYLSRTQPPILTLLVDLLFSSQLPTQKHKLTFFKNAVQAVENEYNFWMAGVNDLTPKHSSNKRVVLMADGSVLNRYWDDSATPRPESYREDLELTATLDDDERGAFYRNIRAACESGWDFSSRWLANNDDLLTIQTTDIVPVDLNCLLYQVEEKLSYYYQWLELPHQSEKYRLAAHNRKLAINTYLWSEQFAYFFDYNFIKQEPSGVYSLAAGLALFTNLASAKQSEAISQLIKQKFLQQGGLITTLSSSQQQWDSPNGWAPLHWFVVKGLQNYQHHELAMTVMQRWLNTIENYYASSGKLMEKYNVCQQCDLAAGGEYDVQEGFGWTNGVSQAFYQLLKKY